ncbi:S9 family peptidase [Nafulsella turpanensis]|uniref:S9 family peptidase n=1 Tax=Nafulsella turpanensis TaxID=1265690 RepID=UPI00035E8977|nr:S9 family peptidase [Nafulsella turpanensis]
MMQKKSLKMILLLLFMSSGIYAQEKERPELSVQQIMQDPKIWIGTAPSGLEWAEDGRNLFFYWNPKKAAGDSLYKINLRSRKIMEAEPAEEQFIMAREVDTDPSGRRKLYILKGQLFERDLKSNRRHMLYQTLNSISSAKYDKEGQDILFVQDDNLFKLHRPTAALEQLTDFRAGKAKEEPTPKKQDQWLEQDQLANFEVLRQRKERREQEEAYEKMQEPSKPLTIYTGESQVNDISISPDERFITYQLTDEEDNNSTEVPDYVTESGYTEMLQARPKVGHEQMQVEFGIYDRQLDTTYVLEEEDLPGLDKLPEFANEYKKEFERLQEVIVHGPLYPENGANKALIEIRSLDNKDRWIALLDLETGKPKVLDHQRDEAWIGGPGIDWLFSMGEMGWMPDGQKVWFQSEESGYSHLYTADIQNGKKEQLTSGKFEIYEPQLSEDGKSWYFHANKVHPGERHFYRMPAKGGEVVQLTEMEGRNDVVLSPDEKTLAILHSFANRPPEIYIKPAKAGVAAEKVTESLTEEWKAYPWREPEFITFTASDGTEVPARLYQPEGGSEGKPAVVFVHGAGYLQNAHKWWSSYFREYMFHNLLVDKGYTVLDIDYRGSAGYGRDWRTAIYRHMGGKDLSDQVDGAKWLVEELGADPENLGIYGGSYGGFITLMAMFTQPEVFESGAALRSVTDWAHYNHPYTSNILNEPYADSLAYARSSPIYFAEGLEGNLLIAHGMIDTNVHFQDVVRLSQRLIELGKENWELAVYPLEGHGFVEPSSWTDEYSRILKLFEETLKDKAPVPEEGSN